MDRTILLTGATGYIGSHTWVALIEAGYTVLGLDNFSNSSAGVLARIATLTGREPGFVQADVRDATRVAALLRRHAVGAVVHFAALKAVGESVAAPLRYYDNNLGGLIRLASAMSQAGVHRLVFSSSATVYDASAGPRLDERAPLQPASPYGRTKRMAEQILDDIATTDPRWRIACLRYFNPVGAHPSGLIGEDPRGTPNNLMPYVAQVAVGRRPQLAIFGDDYPTPDGTGVRDYLHVDDLARGHVAALARLQAEPGSFVVNLGTGRGHSVRELVAAFARAAGRPIPCAVAPRRAGDAAAYFADPARAAALLGWRAEKTLDMMCADTWRWQSMNPDGYGSEQADI